MTESGQELVEYTDVLEGLSKRFIKSDNLGLFLSAENTALFKQKMMEAISVIDDLLGKGNIYTGNIINTANSSSGGFVGGPSFAAVREISGIILAAQKEIDRKRNSPQRPEIPLTDLYVSAERLRQLSAATSSSFDLARLVRLCEELNSAHANKCYMSIAMILRAIIDHVPPIFAVQSFSEIANNYAGAKSFKESMTYLNASLRKVADAHLHVQIRPKEILPEFTQVDFDHLSIHCLVKLFGFSRHEDCVPAHSSTKHFVRFNC